MSPASLPTAATRVAARAAAASLILAAFGCTISVGGVAIPIPDPTVDLPIPAPPSSGAGSSRVLARADDYVGVPYKWGGTSPRTGFDCSGYVQYVYRREGVELPRTSRQQAVAGARRPTRWDAAGPGDLAMFANPGEKIGHVAFYVGNDRIIHSSSSGGGVRYDDLSTRRGQWYRQRLVAVRRVSGRGSAIAKGLLEQLGLAHVRLDPPDRAPRPQRP